MHWGEWEAWVPLGLLRVPQNCSRRASSLSSFTRMGYSSAWGGGCQGRSPLVDTCVPTPAPNFRSWVIPGLLSTTAAGFYLLTTRRLGLVKKIPQTQTAEATLLFRVKIKSFQNFALCLLSFQELLAIAKSTWLKQGSSITQLRRHAEVSKEGRAEEHRESEATTSLLLLPTWRRLCSPEGPAGRLLPSSAGRS